MIRNALLLLLVALQATVAVADVTPTEPYSEVYENTLYGRTDLYNVRRLYMADDSGNTMLLQAPSLSADTTVVTLPATNGTSGQALIGDGAGALSYGDIVTPTGTQTLTNKTLTSPTISGPTVTGTLLLQNPSGSQPELHLSEDPDNGTNRVAIKAPASIADFTLTLPPDDGDTGEVLSTDGSGVLDWAAPLTNPMDSNGDMIYGGASGAATKLDSGTSGQWLISGGAGAPSWTNTTTTGKMIDGSADEVQLTIQGNGTQTTSLLLLENSGGTDVMTVSNGGGIVLAGGVSTQGAVSIPGDTHLVGTTVAASTSCESSCGALSGSWNCIGAKTVGSSSATTCSTTSGARRCLCMSENSNF